MPKLYRDFDTQAQIDAQYNPSLVLTDATAPGKHFVAQARLLHPEVQTGRFGADMQLHLVNDGPVTIPLQVSLL